VSCWNEASSRRTPVEGEAPAIDSLIPARCRPDPVTDELRVLSQRCPNLTFPLDAGSRRPGSAPDLRLGQLDSNPVGSVTMLLIAVHLTAVAAPSAPSIRSAPARRRPPVRRPLWPDPRCNPPAASRPASFSGQIPNLVGQMVWIPGAPPTSASSLRRHPSMQELAGELVPYAIPRL